jgi:flagellar motor switch protein FliN/FliY
VKLAWETHRFKEGPPTVADSSDETTEQPQAGDAPSVDVPTQEKTPGKASGDANLDTDEIEKLLNQATESLEQVAGDEVSTTAEPKPFSLGDLTPDTSSQERQPIDLLGEVEMDLRIELGRTQMKLEEVLHLRSGSVVALDKLAGDPVDVFVNGRLIARGEVLVMNDNFCIRVTELIGS